MNNLTKIRLSCHQLVDPAFTRPGDLVSRMGALQAQDYTMAKWAVGIRLKNSSLSAINEALQSGEIIRTHVMRPTWHFVAGKDIRWMLLLSAQRVKKSIDLWTQAKGLDISESLYSRCNDLIAGMLSGRQQLTKEEISSNLEQKDIPADGEHMRRYLLRAETEGIICSGGDKAGKPTYALLDEQAPLISCPQREEALAELAGRYFSSHSPATLKDFTWWSGLTNTEARQAIASIREQLETVNAGGSEFYIHRSVRETKQQNCLHFLPPYDEYLVAYKERHSVMDPQHFPKAFNTWGIFHPVILYRGRVVGNWKKVRKNGQLTTETFFFESCPRMTGRMLQNAENHYRSFCAG